MRPSHQSVGQTEMAVSSAAHSRGQEEEEEEENSGSIGIEYMALRPDLSQLTSIVAFI